MEKTTHLLTSASLKALAHPIRVQLLGLLRLEGPSTATALGARIGESSGTTSYHLRQLADADFVVQDLGRGNARERWWEAAQDSTRLDTGNMENDTETAMATDAYLDAVARMNWRRLEQWLRTSRTWPKKWQKVTTISDYSLSLTPAELDRLNQQVGELLETFQREPRKGDERVSFQYQSFPEKHLP